MNPVADKVGFDVQAMRVWSAQNVTTSGTSARSTALDGDTRVVRLVATTATWLAFGSNPTATTSGTYLPAESVEYFTVAGSSKIAALQVASAGSLNISEMR